MASGHKRTQKEVRIRPHPAQILTESGQQMELCGPNPDGIRLAKRNKFEESATFAKLASLISKEASIKTTQLSEEYSFEMYLKHRWD